MKRNIVENQRMWMGMGASMEIGLKEAFGNRLKERIMIITTHPDGLGDKLGSKVHGVYRIRPVTGSTEPQKPKEQSRESRDCYGNDYATCEYHGRN